MKRSNLALIAAATLCAAPLEAQTRTDTAAAADTAPMHAVFVRRTLTGLLGWIGGAAVGGYIGAHVDPSPCNCDDPGLRETLTGFVFGGAIGAGLGAGGPKLNSECSWAQRVGLGILGSAVGTGIGIVRLTDGSQAVTVPIFSIIGASLAEVRC